MATTKLDDDAKRDVRREFDEAVNMTAAQLKRWLDEVAVLADGPGPRPADVTHADVRPPASRLADDRPG